jgi:hypothetical protein
LKRSGWRWRPHSTSSVTRQIALSRTLIVKRYSLNGNASERTDCTINV